MAEKIIFNNGHSELRATYDGEIVGIEQGLIGSDAANSILMYEDELESVIEFVKNEKNLKEGEIY